MPIFLLNHFEREAIPILKLMNGNHAVDFIIYFISFVLDTHKKGVPLGTTFWCVYLGRSLVRLWLACVCWRRRLRGKCHADSFEVSGATQSQGFQFGELGRAAELSQLQEL